MLRRLRLSSTVLAVALVTGACGPGADPISGSNSAALSSGSECPTGSTLTYANFGQAFMSAHCTSCHSGRTSPDLSTQAAIQASRAAIDAAAASGPNGTATRMPQGASIATSERVKLGEWLACGAP
jgi:mono/diheme cytochrome c family protein